MNNELERRQTIGTMHTRLKELVHGRKARTPASHRLWVVANVPHSYSVLSDPGMPIGIVIGWL